MSNQSNANIISRLLPVSYYDINGDGKVPTYKERCVRDICYDMFERTQSMFKYDGLPETIPARILELYLQMNGHCAFYKYDDKLYVFTGALGGEPDVYYMPTIYTIANPALALSVNAKIGEDCVVMPNDSLYRGLSYTIRKYASYIVENEISIKLAQVNSRIIAIPTADTDPTKDAGEKYLEDIYNGKQGIIANKGFIEGIKTQPYASAQGTNIIKSLIELEQYLKASLYNELGLNANFNMKRESLNSAESALNDDSLLPLVDDMLKSRRNALEKVNKMFGTDISVKLASSWEDNQIEVTEEQKAINSGDDVSGQPEKTDDAEGDNNEQTDVE